MGIGITGGYGMQTQANKLPEFDDTFQYWIESHPGKTYDDFLASPEGRDEDEAVPAIKLSRGGMTIKVKGQ